MHLEAVVASIIASCSTVKIRSIYAPGASDIVDNCTVFNRSFIACAKYWQAQKRAIVRRP